MLRLYCGQKQELRHGGCNEECRSRMIWPFGKAGGFLSQRQSNLLWMRDLLEHLTVCQQQLAWANDAEAIQILTETMLRDLESCRRLCEGMNRRLRLQHAV